MTTRLMSKTQTIFENQNFLEFIYLLKSSDFQKSFKNSKKIPKNVKFGLQAHFNMEINLNGSDRRFEL